MFTLSSRGAATAKIEIREQLKEIGWLRQTWFDDTYTVTTVGLLVKLNSLFFGFSLRLFFYKSYFVYLSYSSSGPLGARRESTPDTPHEYLWPCSPFERHVGLGEGGFSEREDPLMLTDLIDCSVHISDWFNAAIRYKWKIM